MLAIKAEVYVKRKPRLIASHHRARHRGRMSDYEKSDAAHDGARLRALIARQGMSNAQFAEALGVTPQTVLTVWIGQGKIARARIPMICDLLNCSSDELLGLRPIDRPSEVAEAVTAYRSLDQDARDLLGAFSRMSTQNKAQLLGIAKSLSNNSTFDNYRRSSDAPTFHRSLSR